MRKQLVGPALRPVGVERDFFLVFAKVFIFAARMRLRHLREIQFWITFLGINFLLFVPAYLAKRGQSDFFPWLIWKADSWVGVGKALLYNRENFDIFRLSSEFSLILLSLILFAGPPYRRAATRFSLGFYLLLLLYQIYHQSFSAFYQTPPFFYNDWGLIRVGWQILWNDWQWFYLLVLLLALLLLLALARALRFLLQRYDHRAFSPVSYTIFVFILLESLVFAFRWGYRAWPEHVLQFQVAPILTNARESLQAARQMSRLDVAALADHRPYADYRLQKRPNFYFLFIESYGRLLYDEPGLRTDYERLLGDLEGQLADSAWYAASALSRAPVTGAGSWVSYSSFLDGFDYRNRGTYWALFENETFYRYQHLLRWLQGQGYRNYRLSAIGGTTDDKIPWETHRQLYAVDEWIRNSDFDYRGLLYGWGPSPPDQFSLHFAHDRIQRTWQGPYTLFFISQNSHNPFVSPTEVAPDWRLLNDSTVHQASESRFFEPPSLENYGRSIRYQLEYLIDFILREGGEEDIFFLVGDHQPPLFPLTKLGMETPVHLIAKNRAFVEAFQRQGLQLGLRVDDGVPYLRHEGFYSLLVHHLWPHYGDSSRVAPPYLPQGLDVFGDLPPTEEKKY
ncbi:MAG: sulfatase-like hydrolase/transferase [Bacteroidota bacterium]